VLKRAAKLAAALSLFCQAGQKSDVKNRHRFFDQLHIVGLCNLEIKKLELH
jgi:hypothetical protein